jgi:hypothetical protein
MQSSYLTRATFPAHLILLDFIILIIFHKSISYEAPHYAILSNALHHFIHLWSKFSPLHPALKYPKCMLLSQCDRPIFTPMQHYRQVYNFVKFNSYLLRELRNFRRSNLETAWRQSDLSPTRMVTKRLAYILGNGTEYVWWLYNWRWINYSGNRVLMANI